VVASFILNSSPYFVGWWRAVGVTVGYLPGREAQINNWHMHQKNKISYFRVLDFALRAS
jgi:hypothetical protein